MSLLMMLALGSKPAHVAVTQTRTFTSNTPFQMPAGVTVLDSLSGYGGAGDPGDPGTPGTTTTKQVTHNYKVYIRRDGSGSDFTDQGYTDGWPPGGTAYYDNFQTFSESDSSVYSGSEDYHDPETQTTTVPGTPATSPTTGPSASGFGKVFPGGTGGMVTTTSYMNVPVTGGASYTVSVPDGGSITITYKV